MACAEPAALAQHLLREGGVQQRNDDELLFSYIRFCITPLQPLPRRASASRHHLNNKTHTTKDASTTTSSSSSSGSGKRSSSSSSRRYARNALEKYRWQLLAICISANNYRARSDVTVTTGPVGQWLPCAFLELASPCHFQYMAKMLVEDGVTAGKNRWQKGATYICPGPESIQDIWSMGDVGKKKLRTPNSQDKDNSWQPPNSKL